MSEARWFHPTAEATDFRAHVEALWSDVAARAKADPESRAALERELAAAEAERDKAKGVRQERLEARVYRLRACLS